MEEEKVLNSVIARLTDLGFGTIQTGVKAHIGSRSINLDLVIYDVDDKPFIVGEVKDKLPAKIDKFHSSVTQAFSYANASGCKYFFVADAENITWYQIKSDKENSPVVETLLDTDVVNLGKKNAKNTVVRPSDWSSIVWKFNSVLSDAHYYPDRINILRLFLFFLLTKKTAAAPELELKEEFKIIPGETSIETKNRILTLGKLVAGNKLQTTFQLCSELDNRIFQKIVELLEPFDLSTLDLAQLYQKELIPMFVKTDALQFATRSEIIKFVLNTSDFFKSRKIMDSALGVGSFLVSAAKEKSQGISASLIGVDVNAAACETVEMALRFCEIKNFNLQNEDFLGSSYQTQEKCDFIFCDPPIGMRYYGDVNSDLSSNLIKESKSTTSETLFVLKTLENLSEHGVAMILLPTSVLQSSKHRVFRKTLTDNADILASISWANAYGKFNIPAHLLVFKPKSGFSNSTLFMSLVDDPESRGSFEKQITLASDIYNHFRETGRIKKNITPSFSVVISKELTSDIRLDYSAYDTKHKVFVDQLLNGNAEIIKLSEIAEIKLGILFKPNKETKTDGNVAVVRASNITQGELTFDDLDFINDLDIPDYAFLKDNDILLASLGSSYPIAIVPDGSPKAVFSNSLLRIRVREESSIDPRYLFFILSHQVSKTQMDYLSTGAIVRRATPRLFGDILVPILPALDQSELISKLEILEDYKKKALSLEQEMKDLVSRSLGLEALDES
jgi:16S rRNA G966 N2-methylase RsmD